MDDRHSVDRVRELITRFMRGQPAAIYLFGSHARQAARPGSDIDVAIDPLGPLPVDVLPRLREALEESTIPQHVDLIDLTTTSEAFRVAVIEQGIRWSD